MKTVVHVDIAASQQDVWDVITDIENSVNTISAIDKIDVLEKPAVGLVGLKWEETRTMWGKTATEIMWITHEQAPVYYQTRAESHGSVYVSRLETKAREEGGSRLTFTFEGQAQSFMAKIMSGVFSGMLKRSMVKALEQDLADIKAAAESRAG